MVKKTALDLLKLKNLNKTYRRAFACSTKVYMMKTLMNLEMILFFVLCVFLFSCRHNLVDNSASHDRCDIGSLVPAVHAQMGIKEESGVVWKKVIEVPGGDLWVDAYHHGPAWESEIIGYRVYFDKKSAVDVYGKRSRRLELKKTGWYTPEPLIEQGYGQDILWVGNTLGLGSIRGWDGINDIMIDPVDRRIGRVIEAGPSRGVVELEAKGWVVNNKKVNIKSRFTIYAGQREAIHEVWISDPDVIRLCTGMIKISDAEVLQSDAGMIAQWASNSPDPKKPQAKKTIGLGLFVEDKYFDKFTEDTDDHIVLLKTDPEGYARIVMTAAWDQEDRGYTDSGSFFEYCKHFSSKRLISQNLN
jgi:hypothetical protein